MSLSLSSYCFALPYQISATMTKTKSPLGKYVQAIRNSPKGLFNGRLIATVAMYALGGMPKGEDPLTSLDVEQAHFTNTRRKAGTKAVRRLSPS